MKLVASFMLSIIAAGIQSAQAQPAVILELEVQKTVLYYDDVADPSKLATSANIVAPAATRIFMPWILVGDIVAVNGKPAKGTWVIRGRWIGLNGTNADVTCTDVTDYRIGIQQADGTPLGTVMAAGCSGGTPPPGGPPGQTSANVAIIGGTGAFLGARGQMGQSETLVSRRAASMVETPANRRVNGGGAFRALLHLIPMTRPAVASTPAGPAVFHSDFSLVTTARPAKAGEVLMVMVTGIGPMRQSHNPSDPFPEDRILEVNSPVEVAFAGKVAEVINKVGWPTMVDSYRVDVRVPDGIARGMAALRVTVAFISGEQVLIPME